MKPRPEEIEFAREWIRQFYNSRCIRCQKETRQVDELEPRSQRPGDWWALDNMVCLCQSCDEWKKNTPADISLPILKRCQRAAMEGRSLDYPVV